MTAHVGRVVVYNMEPEHPLCPTVSANVSMLGLFSKLAAGKPRRAHADDDLAIITPVSRSCQDSSAVVQSVEAAQDGEIDGLAMEY